MFGCIIFASSLHDKGMKRNSDIWHCGYNFISFFEYIFLSLIYCKYPILYFSKKNMCEYFLWKKWKGEKNYVFLSSQNSIWGSSEISSASLLAIE